MFWTDLWSENIVIVAMSVRGPQLSMLICLGESTDDQLVSSSFGTEALGVRSPSTGAESVRENG